MTDETVEQSIEIKNTFEIRNKAIKDYRVVYQEVLGMRTDFSRKRGYVRKKQPDEQAFHKAKALFGEFRPFNREVMERNTNGGKGVDVVLPDGNTVHMNDQAQLYDRIVKFNKERGAFYDESNIEKIDKNDFKRLRKINGDLERAREGVLESFEKKGFGFKRLAAIEKEVKAEYATKDIPPTPAVNRAAQKSPTVVVTENREDKSRSTVKPSNPNQTNVEMKDIPINQFAMNEQTPLDWVKAQNDKTIANMRHMMTLSFLQKQQFSVEREHFYNEVHKRFGKSIDSVKDAELFIAKLMNSRESDTLLRDTAPGAVAATKDYINSMDMDKSFREAGYRLDRITSGFRENMQISQAYANCIGGEKGKMNFLQNLSEQKDNYLKGLGDPRVGLAISGSMLAMGVVAGTGPAGLVIGSFKVTQKLLETEKGKIFQNALYRTSIRFLENVGVNPEILKSVSKSVENIWSNSIGSRWGKVALYGAAALALYTFSLPTSEFSAGAGLDSDILQPLPGTSEAIQNKTPLIPPISDTPDTITDSLQILNSVVDIKNGDSLWNIAKEVYELSNQGQTPNNIQLVNMVNEIADHNQIDNPNLIFSGQTIHLPQNLEPSSELVTGPTSWLKDQSDALVNRTEWLNDRTQEWREDHRTQTNEKPPRGGMKI